MTRQEREFHGWLRLELLGQSNVWNSGNHGAVPNFFVHPALDHGQPQRQIRCDSHVGKVETGERFDSCDPSTGVM
ncbi:hypothetical protein OUZ56_015944 [Daphnia magna]|uniref:Uncharacterized protein n=1 Tax=Daphnia magna TaxID=35525 RepID=A0ABR0APA3_9CRUS|nr:hypothetical protein OUZ56_015944 [Daphnia magna]